MYIAQLSSCFEVESGMPFVMCLQLIDWKKGLVLREMDLYCNIVLDDVILALWRSG